jgi:four helix bundle protein
MRRSVVREKSFAFAIDVVEISKRLQMQHKEFVLSRQLLRSGTAIGALIREAEQAESRPDFIHKLAIALKEANETQYWLELLRETNYLQQSDFASVSQKISELLRLLTSIIKKSRSS